MILADPSDVVVVTFDWSPSLPDTVTVDSATHSVDSPMAKVDEGLVGAVSFVKVSGALHGHIHMVTAQATLSNGETINRQFPIRGWNS